MVGLKRNGVALEGSLADEPLLLGDIILVVGNWKPDRYVGQTGPRLRGAELPEE